MDHRNEAPTQGEIEHNLMVTFCRMLDNSTLPPMTVMRMMASALGTIYRQTSSAHQAQECPCGWMPSPSDLDVLQAEMEASARRRPVANLSTVQVAGRA